MASHHGSCKPTCFILIIIIETSCIHRLTWGVSSIFLGAYAILRWLNIPLIVQAQLFGFLCFLCWGQVRCVALSSLSSIHLILYFSASTMVSNAHVLVSITITVLLMATNGLLEYILVFTIKTRTGPSGTHGPTTVIGIIASVLLSVALLPQYWEIYKLKEVTGVSITFLLIDILGGVFNNLSLVFKEKFDVVASLTYTLVIVSSPSFFFSQNLLRFPFI